MPTPQLDLDDADGERWDDRRLTAAVLSGERRAARAMYDRLRPAIDRTLRRILRSNVDDYDDLVQSTFERILITFIEGRFESRSSLETWASAIAGHVALDVIRRRARERARSGEMPNEDELAGPFRTESRLESVARLAQVQEILSKMKPDLAETLLLHDVLGYHLHDIASLRQASMPATQSRLLRARKELKRRASASVVRRPND